MQEVEEKEIGKVGYARDAIHEVQAAKNGEVLVENPPYFFLRPVEVVDTYLNLTFHMGQVFSPLRDSRDQKCMTVGKLLSKLMTHSL